MKQCDLVGRPSGCGVCWTHDIYLSSYLNDLPPKLVWGKGMPIVWQASRSTRGGSLIFSTILADEQFHGVVVHCSSVQSGNNPLIVLVEKNREFPRLWILVRTKLHCSFGSCRKEWQFLPRWRKHMGAWTNKKLLSRDHNCIFKGR